MPVYPRILPLLALFLASAARLALAQDEIGPQKDLPPPDKLAWEVPCNIVMPLEPLLAQGLLTIQQQDKGTAKPFLALLNMDTGVVVWKVDLSGDVVAINASKDTVFVCLRDRVAAVRVADGKALWQQKLEGNLDTAWQPAPNFQQIQWFADFRTPGQGIGGALYYMKDRLYVTVNGNIYALNALTGDEIWDQKYGFSLNSPLLGIGDYLFSATLGGGMQACRVDNGDIVWEKKDMPHADPLFVAGDEKAPELYAASDKGFLRIDPKTGDVMWSADIKREASEAMYVCGDKIVVKRSDDVWVLNRGDGAKVWGAATGHQQSAYANGRVFLRGDKGGDIYCYSVAVGDYAWHSPCPGDNLARLFVGGEVVVAINMSEVEAHDVAKGTVLWRKISTPMQPFETSTWASNDKAIFYRTMDWVYGCDPQRGSWVTSVPGKFFFVHWMWTRGDAVFLHNGAPGLATVGAIIVKARQKGEGG